MPPPEAEMLLTAAVLAFSAVLQTTTGFGFALLSAPLLAALFSPAEAVSTILATGVLVDLLVLGTQGRLPAPSLRDLALVASWTLPGLLVGVVALKVLPAAALQLLAAAAVLLAVWVRTRPAVGARPRRPSKDARWPFAAVAGLASGTLHTSTTLSGPPVVLYLTRRPRPPPVTRDTLIALSLVRMPPSVAILLATDAWVAPRWPVALALAVVAGYLVGRGVFARMDVARYERGVLVVLILAALAAVASALT